MTSPFSLPPGNILGAGAQPAGSTPAGGYNAVAAPAPYRVYPDPATGRSDSGRLIDQKTRSFVLNPDGNLAGMSTVHQCALIAWSHVDPTKIGPFDSAYVSRAKKVYTAAVRDLIDRKQLAILSFAFQRIPGTNALQTTVRWLDRTTQIESEFKP